MGESLAAIGPAVANHLWQSTAFAAVAWAVVLLLRRNQARVRYAVWLAASAKFLVPFALLISLGGMLPRPRHTVVAMPVYSAVDEVGLPFSDVETVPVAAADPTHAAIQPRHEWGTQLWPVVLVGVWLCGVVTVLAVWWVRWRQVAGTLRRAEAAATRQERGARETEVLRQVQRTMGVRVRLVLSGELMEPGVFGVVRPVLIWPERLSERLDDEHIEAILAHELMHVRRRDNLTAVLHMFVEAAFWFHPAVWWLGARLVEERERACDEAVVEMGSRPGVYAEGLLKAVRFCVESPLACVAGVTGADLSRRVRSIMTLRLERLGWGRKLVLLLVALTMVAVPVLLGQGKAAQRMMLAAVNAAPKPVRTWAAAHAMIAVEETPSTGLIAEVQADGAVGQGSGIREQGTGNAAASPDDDALGPAFEVAAIHPANRDDGRHWFGLRLDASGGFTTSSMSLSGLVRTAYVQQPGEGNVSGGPKWAQSDTFDINAKVDDAYMAGWDKLSYGQRLDRVRPMIRRLLADRFQLKLRVEMQPTPVYALVQAKGGARMKEVPAPDPVEGDPMEAQTKWMRDNPEKPMPGSVTCSGHTCTGVAVPMKSAIGQISGSSHADRMVIDQTGLKGYYTFTFTQPRPNDDSAMAEIEDDLGLKFEPRTVPMKTYIIDSAEKPSVDGAEVQAPGDQKQALHGAYKVWLEQDVRWVITDQEAQAFQRLTNDEERDKFIEQFWQRRNPAPDAADNAYRDEIYARIAYANEHFAADQPGWMTDRGHVYIAYGKPDEIDMQPADGTQIWRYRHLPGVGDNIVLKFGDGERKGDYRLMTPMPQTGAGAQTPNPLKRRLTDAERLGGVVQADPPKQRLVGAVVVAPVAQRPTFEVASVKPAPPDADPKTGLWSPPGIGRFTASHVSLALLIQLAFDVSDSQIANKPDWIEANLYDVVAKPEDGVALSREELKPRLQDLLQQRFHLAVHTETRLSSGYALVVAKGGPRLTPTKADHFPGYRLHVGSGDMRGFNWSMPQLAKYLTPAAGFPVVDQTGITGSYDIDFSYEPKPRADSTRPPLDVALKEATGLLLKSEKVPVETIVIDSVDKVPTAN